MSQKRIILIFFIILSFLGGASSAFAAKDYNIKNDTESFFFVNGTSGNVGVGTTVPVGQFDIQAGSTAPAKITNINGTFADLATTKTGLYIDVNASVAGTSGATGSWSEIRVTANAGTYTNAIAGAYGEVLHSGTATADFLMGSVALVNQMGSGTITNAYGLYPQIWKGAGVITHAYGMYYQGVPNLNGDTGTDLGGSVVDQYGVGIRKLTEATTRNIALLIDDTTEGSTTAGNYSIYEESGYPSYFTGNIGIGTLNPEAKLALHSTSTTLVDSHMNEDTTGVNTIESHYAVGQSGAARTTPSDVQNFRFFFGGFDQEVGRISMNTPSMAGATAIGAMDIYTQGAAGTLVRRMTLDEHKAMFATNVGIGTTVPLAALQVGVDPLIPAGSDPVAAIKGNLVVDGKVYGDGAYLINVTAANPTVNNIPKSNGMVLVDSALYEIGGNVGIGTTVPLSKMDIVGSGTTTATSALVLRDADRMPLLTILDNGSMGLGADEPDAMLEINNNTASSPGALPSGTTIHFVQEDAVTGRILVDTFDAISVFSQRRANGTAASPSAVLADDILGNVGALGYGSTGYAAANRVNIGFAAEEDWTDAAYGAYMYFQTTAAGGILMTEKMRISSTGNVGIGTTVPASKLDIVGGAAHILSNPATANIGYATTAGSLYVQQDLEVDGNVYLGDATADNLTVIGMFNMTGGANYTGPVTISTTHAGAFVVRQQSSGTQIFNVDTVAGNVGVGSTAPRSLLEVGSGALIPSGSLPAAVVKGDLVVDGRVYGDGSTLTGIVSSQWTTTGTDIYYNTGNVGVGTTGPNTKLHVDGNGAFGNSVTSSNAERALNLISTNATMRILRISADINVGSPAIELMHRTSADGVDTAYWDWFLNSTGMVFRDRFNDVDPFKIEHGALDNSFYIRNTGNIGIGTTTPVARMHIGDGGTAPGMPITGNDLYVKGNIEFDGAIYGDGSQLGNIAKLITGLTATRVPVASGPTTLVDSVIYSVGNNVGIGTTTPLAKLNIVGEGELLRLGYDGSIYNSLATSSSGVLSIGSNGITNFKIGTDPVYPGYSNIWAGGIAVPSETNFSWQTQNNGNSVWFNAPAGGYIAFTTNGALTLPLQVFGTNVGIGYLYNNAVPNLLSVNGQASFAGNVGIGTTAPAAKLTVVGSGSGTGLAFEIDDNLYNPKFVVLDNGNAGIGTSAPRFTLEVDGKVYASGNFRFVDADQSIFVGTSTAFPATQQGTSLGYNALANNTGRYASTLGAEAGLNNTGWYLSALGWRAGFGNTGDEVVGVGYLAAYNNQGATVLALGDMSAHSNTADLILAVGYQTGWANSGEGLTAFGHFAGSNNSGLYATYLGYAAGWNATGSYTLGIGYDALRSSTANNVVAIGYEAGENNATAAQFILKQNNVNTMPLIQGDFISGNVGLGTTTPLARLQVGVGGPDAMSATGGDLFIKGNIEFDGKIYGDGSALTNLPGGVSGLTTSSVPRASNATTLVDSGIYALVTGNVGIGTVSPAARLELVGSGTTSATSALVIRNANQEAQVTVLDNGNVGIGTTETGARKLLVEGDIESTANFFAVHGIFDRWSTYSGNGLLVEPYYVGTNAATAGVNISINPNFSSGTNYVLRLTPEYDLTGTSSDVDLFINRTETTLGSGSHHLMRLQQNGSDKFAITNNGNVGLGTAVPLAQLQVGVNPGVPAGSLPAAAIKGNLVVDGKIYGDGTGLTGVSVISGLADNYLTRANGSTAIENSIVYDDGTNIGIGTNVPVAKLEVKGGVISSPHSGVGSERFGLGSSATGDYDTAFGNGTTATGSYSAAFGYNVDVGGTYSVGMGINVTVNGDDSLVLGEASSIGAAVTRTILLGNDNSATVSNSVGIGRGIGLSFENIFVVGTGAGATAANQVVIGSDGLPKTDVYFGNGVRNAAPSVYTLHGTSGSGTDIAGANLQLAGGQGTGAGAGGAILLQTSAAGATGVATNALATRVAVTGEGNVGVGTTVPLAKLQVGVDPNIPSGSLPAEAIKGNLVVDGKIYGNGSGLTNITGAVSGLTATRVPVASNSTTLVDSIIYSVGSSVGIGNPAPTRPLHISSSAPDSAALGNNNAIFFIDGQLNSVTRQQAGIGSNPYINPPSASTQNYLGLGFTPVSDSAYVSGAEIMGLYGGVYYYGTNTLGTAYGALFKNYAADTSTITSNYSVYIDPPYKAAGASILNNYGLYIGTQSEGTNTNFAIYSEGGLNYFGSNVGIGSTRPAAKLDIVGLGTTAATSAILIRDSAKAVKVAVLGNGNVGISTALPLAGLSVGAGTPNAMPVLGGDDVYIAGNLEIDGRIYGDGTGLTNVVGAISGLNAGYVPRASTSTTIIDSVIYQNGSNIGIGTTVPAFKLDLLGDVNADFGARFRNINSGATAWTNNHFLNDVGSIGWIGAGSSSTAAAYMNRMFLLSDSAGVSIIGFNTGDIRFYTAGDTASAERIRITNNGNVGIGTITPIAKLVVAGTGSTTGRAFEIDNNVYSPKVVVLDNGNVGIGTVNPQSPLVVVGGGAQTDVFFSTNTNNDFDMIFGRNGSNIGTIESLTTGISLSALNNLSVFLTDDAGSGLTVRDGGNVGVGTIVPISTLEVAAAGTLAIPQGTAPTVSKAGHIAVDTTADQFLYYGTGERVLAYEQTRCGYFADLLSTDDQISMGAFAQPVTITGVGCTYNGTGTTLATFTLENGAGTAMTITGTNPTCTANNTAFTFAAVTASNSLTAGQIIRFNVTNTPAPSTDDYTICIRYVYTRQ